MKFKLYTHSIVPDIQYQRDAVYLPAGLGTASENLMEFGARVCYRSVANTGDSNDMVQRCINNQHYDVMRHGHAVLWMQHYPEHWKGYEFLKVMELGNYHLFVAGNLHAWWDVLKEKDRTSPTVARLIRTQLNQIAPTLFPKTQEQSSVSADLTMLFANPVSTPQVAMENVQLIGISKDIFVDATAALKLNQATFYIDGFSRSASMQILRHAGMSYSQESQRYVGYDKAAWDWIIPPEIAKLGSEVAERISAYRIVTEELYHYLREQKVRKEDARFFLPNAMETRIVMSGNFAAWKHFLYLREAKDAQWEIRGIAKQVRQLLHEVAPHVF